ncbi:MAG: hypothetical protein WD749_01085 [Phycisphaerales bacterium]
MSFKFATAGVIAAAGLFATACEEKKPTVPPTPAPTGAPTAPPAPTGAPTGAPTPG